MKSTRRDEEGTAKERPKDITRLLVRYTDAECVILRELPADRESFERLEDPMKNANEELL